MYQNKKHKIKAIVLTAVTAPIAMWVLPMGTFDPSTFGFWYCIVFAFITGFSTDYVLYRYRKWLVNSKYYISEEEKAAEKNPK